MDNFSTSTAPVERQPICMTDVTLRDGMQQDNITPRGGATIVPVEDRIEVFEALVDAGMQRIEIGHLGNEDGQDIAFAQNLVARINKANENGNTRYDGVQLQVLFGSQKELIGRGVASLDGIDKDMVVVHVYDRLSPNLRRLAATAYTSKGSASRVIDAAKIALDHGFTNFSISGEGATDPELAIDEAIEFYVTITDQLIRGGATSVNCNFANTFGFSVTDATEAELAYFNHAVKKGRPQVTTSVHTHNDYNGATGYAMAAIRAGFDCVEGTMIGMGERAGNVAIADVTLMLLEDAQARIDREANGRSAQRLGRWAVRESIWNMRAMEPSIVAAYDGMFAACRTIADIFGTHNRWQKTSLGGAEAFDAGSGPHAQANREFLRDPLGRPLWRNYGSSAVVYALLGRPEAQQILRVDPERIKAITINTHAAGGSTNDVLNGAVEIGPEAERQMSEKAALSLMRKIVDLTSDRDKFGGRSTRSNTEA